MTDGRTGPPTNKGTASDDARRGLFAAARDVRDVSECSFYHVMDLPGLGTVGGQWDLRATIDEYLASISGGSVRSTWARPAAT